MIDMATDADARLLTLTASGLISEYDIDACSDRLDATIDLASGPKSLLLDWERLDGWEQGAKTLGTILGLRSWAWVRRVALIADERWDDEALRIADIYKAAQVQRFSPKRRSEAMAWLKAD